MRRSRNGSSSSRVVACCARHPQPQGRYSAMGVPAFLRCDQLPAQTGGRKMVVHERERRGLHQALVTTLGEEAADTLMAQLPTIDQETLATREDIAALSQRMDDRIEASEQRLLAAFRGELNAAITAQTRAMIFATGGAIVSLGGLALALARLV